MRLSGTISRSLPMQENDPLIPRRVEMSATDRTLRFPLPRQANPLPSQTALPLAHGDLSAEDAAELTSLKHQIHTAIGLNCELYKEKCLRRRLAVRMRARGVHTYSQYAHLLRKDKGEYERLLD